MRFAIIILVFWQIFRQWFSVVRHDIIFRFTEIELFEYGIDGIKQKK